MKILIDTHRFYMIAILCKLFLNIHVVNEFEAFEDLSNFDA